jgi:hypothetical protein
VSTGCNQRKSEYRVQPKVECVHGATKVKLPTGCNQIKNVYRVHQKFKCLQGATKVEVPAGCNQSKDAYKVHPNNSSYRVHPEQFTVNALRWIVTALEVLFEIHNL